jgi:tetratricopeptide (TPR) repeat protein
MPNELTSEHAKALFDFVSFVNRGQDTVYSVRLLERLAEIGDPFYTPFALSLLDANYRKLGRNDLELQTQKRVTLLPKDQQILLNPAWVAACYQKTGDFKTARELLGEILSLSPDEPSAIAALAEISLLTNNAGDAQARSAQLQRRPEPNYQILGHLFSALALHLTGHAAESAKELNWIRQFIISAGNVPPGAWDYRDLHPLLPKMGTNANAASALLDVLSGRIALPEFAKAWTEVAEPPADVSRPGPQASAEPAFWDEARLPDTKKKNTG